MFDTGQLDQVGPHLASKKTMKSTKPLRPTLKPSKQFMAPDKGLCHWAVAHNAGCFCLSSALVAMLSCSIELLICEFALQSQLATSVPTRFLCGTSVKRKEFDRNKYVYLTEKECSAIENVLFPFGWHAFKRHDF